MKHFAQQVRDANSAHRQEGYRGKISTIGEDGRAANIENMSGSTLSNARILLPYGISSIGAAGMYTHVMLDGNRGSLIGVDDPNRPTPEIGELILYGAGGTAITIHADGSVTISGDVTFTGNLTVNGKLTASNGLSVSNGIAISGTTTINGNTAITGSFTVNGRSPRYD